MYTLAKNINVIFRLPFSALNKTQLSIYTVPVVNITLILVTRHKDLCVLIVVFAFMMLFD